MANKRKDSPSKGANDAIKTPKRQKTSESKNKSPSKTSATSSSADNQTATPSTLRRSNKEEPSFPRGGASALTPLEYKEVVNEATREVLFETKEEKSVAPEKSEKKRRQSAGKASSAKKQKKDDVDDREPEVKIEQLSYKKLVPGQLVFGFISKITKNDVAIALPNNLIGYAPLTSISEQYTNLLKASLGGDGMDLDEDEEEHEDEDKSDDVDVPALDMMFEANQPIRAYIMNVSIGGLSGNKKQRKHIELSLLPSLTNPGITATELVRGVTLQASVKSIEDNGYVMDLGLDFASGFLARSDSTAAPNTMKVGRTFLCYMTGSTSGGKVIQLASDFNKAIKGKVGKTVSVSDAPTIDSFLPGTLVSKLLITDVYDNGLACKLMGSVDVTVDLFQSGCYSGETLQNKYKVGKSITARLLATIPGSENKKFAASLLEHVKDIMPAGRLSLSKIPIGTIKSDATVKHIIPGSGLILNVGMPGLSVFVHISRISDKKIDIILPNGPYKVGSQHAVRILDYNSMDGLLLASMEQKIISQRYLRIEDVKPGDVVKGKITRFTAGGMMVEIEEGMEAYVPEIHMSDVVLQHPEKKFREGASVKGRILRVDVDLRRMKMTLKKAIVNSEGPVFADYIDVEEDEETPGTIVKLMPTGAILEFYGEVKGFLPVSEMSEAFIKDPMEHFKVGQTLNVHVISSDPMHKKVRLSCKSSEGESSKEKAEAFKNIALGSLIDGTIVEKSSDDVVVDLKEGIKGLLVLGHLTDGSREKSLASFKKLRAGQKLSDLVVLRKDDSRSLVHLTAKPSIVKAAKSDALVKSFLDAKVGALVSGFVKDITHFGIFVGFIGATAALLPRKVLPKEIEDLPDYGYQRLQSISCYVTDIIPTKEQFTLSLRAPAAVAKTVSVPKPEAKKSTEGSITVLNPVDSSISSIEDFENAGVTKGRITSIKPTQLNIDLADNVKGRVDVSEFFDSWDSIKNKKLPFLRHGLTQGQEIDVKVIGLHDTKSHRYLPISHRIAGKLLTYELTAKPSSLKAKTTPLLSYADIKRGDTYLAFVNNVQPDHLWVSISPSVRGRIKILDISDDIAVLSNLEKRYPIGTALKVTVIDVDVDTGRLELSARYNESNKPLDWESITEGMMIPGRVSKITDGKVLVQLSEHLLGSIALADMADNYDQAKATNFEKDSVLRVCVLNADSSNKKIHLSTRPSRILDSSSKVRDPEVKTAADINVGKTYRGFVTNVADNGVYIHLGGTVVARARIADLSDEFVKDWKKNFKVNQLVKGKIMSVDLDSNQVNINLKKSVINGTAKKTIADYQAGDFVDGNVRKVTEFGCFIVIEGSDNVSGLCHKSQISDQKDPDPHKLFSEGDLVKAKILKVDRTKGRISFGLKASFFADLPQEELVPPPKPEERLIIDASEEEESDDEEEEDGGVKLASIDDVVLTGIDRPLDSSMSKSVWASDAMDDLFAAEEVVSEEEEEEDEAAKPKKKKSTIKVDMTADLDTRQPQTSADFERLLLATPNDALLWMAYMATTVGSGDILGARAIAERALKKIDHRNQEAKLNIWIARLNLELEFGTPETLEVTFKNACQYNDSKKVHQGMCSIYIQAKKFDKADELFQSMTKKFSQDEKVWVNYLTFLMENGRADDARVLLSKTLQAIQDTKIHPLVTLKFAQLEYKSGEVEMGRTVFEKLLGAYPNRLDLWNVYIDTEIKQGDLEAVRRLFPRVLAVKLSAKKANSVFNKWLEFEKRFAPGDKKKQDYVISQAKDYTKRLAEQKARKEEEVGAEDDGEDEEDE